MTIELRIDGLWKRAEPPSLAHPYWRSLEDDARLHYCQVHAVADGHAHEVEQLHCLAIAELAEAAARHRAAGTDHDARRLAHAAARLAQEIVGLW
jgi:hypothetical protein